MGGGGRSKRQRGVVGRGAQWAQWAPGRVEERSEALIKSTCQARSGAFARVLSLSLSETPSRVPRWTSVLGVEAKQVPQPNAKLASVEIPYCQVTIHIQVGGSDQLLCLLAELGEGQGEINSNKATKGLTKPAKTVSHWVSPPSSHPTKAARLVVSRGSAIFQSAPLGRHSNTPCRALGAPNEERDH